MTYRICFVCTGNICRSPMAEAVMRELVEDAGLSDRVEVDSAGTDDWHVGDAADRRAVTTLRAAGYDGSTHRARVFDRRWFAERDLVVALDRGHLRELRAMARDASERDKVALLRDFDEGTENLGDRDVADPYYGGDAEFATVLAQVERACRGVLDGLLREGRVGAASG
jgi:protein-tyrosine phosphatase